MIDDDAPVSRSRFAWDQCVACLHVDGCEVRSRLFDAHGRRHSALARVAGDGDRIFLCRARAASLYILSRIDSRRLGRVVSVPSDRQREPRVK